MSEPGIRVFEQPHVNAIFYHDFCSGRESDFIDRLRDTIDADEILKEDTKALLTKTSFDGRTIVVKHYRYVGLVHALAHTLTCSRARYAWNATLRLLALGVPTHRPLACIECFGRGLLKTSYFVYDYVKGFRFREYAWTHTPDTIMKEPHVHQVYALLRQLRVHRVSHGDLKMPNILITETGAVLIDLDQVRFHRFAPIFAKRRLRDLRRFRKELPWNRSSVVSDPP